ncbi:MAG: DUF5131 family protein [Candidatus Thorarchaeota archaeon]
MSINRSKIPYLTHVWNVAVGCERDCPYCWARPLAKRIGQSIGCKLCEEFTPHVHPERMKIPGGKPKVIGLGFMTDLFAPCTRWLDARKQVCYWESRGLVDLFAGYIGCSNHTFITSTKFPGNIAQGFYPPPNWYLLVTCTNQEDVDKRLPVALERWMPWRVVLNLEPLCGPVCIDTAHLLGELRCDGCGQRPAFGDAVAGQPHALYHQISDPPELCGFYHDMPGVAGVIVGGMSGPMAKRYPLDLDWVRRIRDECEAAGVPFAYKQANGGEQWPELDGRRHKELPWGWRR